MTQKHDTDRISTGYYDVEVDFNIADEDLVEAYQAQAPTCALVVEIHPHGQETKATTHYGKGCKLCTILESYVRAELSEDEP